MDCMCGLRFFFFKKGLVGGGDESLKRGNLKFFLLSLYIICKKI